VGVALTARKPARHRFSQLGNGGDLRFDGDLNGMDADVAEPGEHD